MRGVDNNGRLLPNMPVDTVEREDQSPQAHAQTGAVNGLPVQTEAASTPRASASRRAGDSGTSTRTTDRAAAPSAPTTAAPSVPSTWIATGVQGSSQAKRLNALQDKALIQKQLMQRDLSTNATQIERVRLYSRAAATELARKADEVRFHSQRGDMVKAQELLGDLKCETERYHAPCVEIERLRAQISDLERWGCPPAQLKDARAELKSIEKELTTSSFDDVDRRLAIVGLDIEQDHAPLLNRMKYHIERTRVLETYDRIEPIAERAAQAFPELAPLLADYRQSRLAAEQLAQSGDPAFAALHEVAQAGEKLLETLTQHLDPVIDNDAHPQRSNHPLHALYNELDGALGMVYDRMSRRLGVTRPDNFNQAIVCRAPPPGARPLAKLTWLQNTRAVLAPQGDVQRPPAQDEKKYFRALHDERTHLSSLYTLANRTRPTSFNPDGDPFSAEERAALNDFTKALDQLPRAHVFAESNDRSPSTRNQRVTQEEEKLRNNPSRYTEELQKLAVAKQRADTATSLLRQRFGREIEAIDSIGDPVKRTEKAAEFMRGPLFQHGGGTLASRVMTPRQQVKLLNALSAESMSKRMKLPREVEQNLSEVYQSTRLTDEFRGKEKEVRKQVIAELMAHHKHDLQHARDVWPTLTAKEKLETAKLITRTYCEVAGFKEPSHIVISDESESCRGYWEESTRTLAITRSGGSLEDFESTLNTVFHENSHNWQHQLAAGIRNRPPKIAESDPLYWQAHLFATNTVFYQDGNDKDDGGGAKSAAYLAQPMEAHAMLAGPRFARDLMRALDE